MLLLLVYWTTEIVYTFKEFRRDVSPSEPYRLGFFWLRVGMMGRFLRVGNEVTYFIKCGEFLALGPVRFSRTLLPGEIYIRRATFAL